MTGPLDRRAALRLGAAGSMLPLAASAEQGGEAAGRISILDFGARTDAPDNRKAIEAALAAALANGRTLEVPPGEFRYSQIDLGRNDAVSPARLALTGSGTLRSTFRGTSIIASRGLFYDLVVEGVRFESVEGAGTALIDGDAFMRLIFTPGTQINGFDWVIRAKKALQSIRMIGCIVRGGLGAVVRAPMAYDCVFTHNIIEFATDGIVIDGDGDPAVHTCTIDSNLIEGMGGRAIVLGPCLATSIRSNYLEGNSVGDILLDAGTAPHKGLSVQSNSIQLPQKRIDAGNSAIVWGNSVALPVRSGGNYSNGRLHDIRGATSLIDMSGDFAAGELYNGYSQKEGRKAPIGRAVYNDGLSSYFAWFDRFLGLNPYANEIEFGGRFRSRIGETDEPPVITFGNAPPATAHPAPERKRWARGSVVLNAEVSDVGPTGWICIEAGTPGRWRVLNGR